MAFGGLEVNTVESFIQFITEITFERILCWACVRACVFANIPALCAFGGMPFYRRSECVCLRVRALVSLSLDPPCPTVTVSLHCRFHVAFVLAKREWAARGELL